MLSTPVPSPDTPLMGLLRTACVLHFATLHQSQYQLQLGHHAAGVERFSSLSAKVIMEDLCREPSIKTVWKRIGNVPLWRLLKQFPRVFAQQRDGKSGHWSVWLSDGSKRALRVGAFDGMFETLESELARFAEEDALARMRQRRLRSMSSTSTSSVTGHDVERTNSYSYDHAFDYIYDNDDVYSL